MHTPLKLLAAFVVLSSSLSLADLPQGEVVIRTRKGGLVMGRVLSETSKGYLVSGADGTSVVEFAAIADIRQLAAQQVASVEAAPLPPPPPAPMVVVAQPPAPRVDDAPPPPVRPSEPSISEVASQAPERVKGKREGFHFGLGLGAMMLPYGPMAEVEAHFEVNFGRPAYRATVNAGLLAVDSWAYLNVSVDNLFQFHIGDVYAFGAGLKVGLTAIARTYVYAAPVIQPVIITLGERGQHQFSLTGSFAVLSTVSEYYEPLTGRYYPISFAGTLQAYLGYTYLF